MNHNQEIEAFVERLLEADSNPANLLQHMISIQHAFGAVPPDAVRLLATRLRRSDGQVRAVASFYSLLNLDQPRRYQILFSDNITDRYQGNAGLMQRLKDSLPGADASIGYTSCSGLCDQGPGMLVNGCAINRVDPGRIDQMARLVQDGIAVEAWPDDWFAIESNIRRRDIQFESRFEPGDALRRWAEQEPQDLIREIEAAGLRGRGGAGFPTATKWRFCREADGDTRYVVCNADEGEPGTFKDRVLLDLYADEMFEGMTLCAHAISAPKGFVYLRGEYRFLLDKLQQTLDRRRQDGLLGRDVAGYPGFHFDIEIHLGAGAYICGEESALINSLEGKRGNPRLRPPFPVERGYLDQPTVVDNVETFWSAAHIAVHGAEWFSRVGNAQSAGTRLLSISGDCANPGVYEYPFGVSLNTILADCGGEDAQAVQMAGAAGHTVLRPDFGRILSFDDLVTGGSFMVIGPERDLLDLLHNFAVFFEHESCGFCTPCRVGTRLIYEIIDAFRQGRGSTPMIDQLRDVGMLMQRDSFCGLGSSAPTAFLDALNQSPELFGSRLAQQEGPVFDLEEALAEFRSVVDQEVEHA
jgi:[NiFe] hydrogenase diaphorase moiety large subunit